MVTFCPNGGSAIHVVNQTRSTIRSFVALCGRAFSDVTETRGRIQATCSRCKKLDNPFLAGKVPHDPETWVWALANTGNARTALLTRDLITVDGKVTSRGAILARDLTYPTPWVDCIGIVHTRLRGGARGHGVCGAELLGLHTMTYDKLDKTHTLYKDADVSCMACVVYGVTTS